VATLTPPARVRETSPPLGRGERFFVDLIALNAQRQARDQARHVERFRQFLVAAYDKSSVTRATIFQFIEYISREVVPHTASRASLQKVITAVDQYRLTRNAKLPRWQQSGSATHALLSRARRLWGQSLTMPVPLIVGDLPSTHELIPFLPQVAQEPKARSSVSTNTAMSQRTLLLVRIVTLLRAGDVVQIDRKSIARVVIPGPPARAVVRFTYHSKRSAASNWAIDSNYVEFLPDNPQLCPATALLHLKLLVDDVVGDKHNRLFIVWGPRQVNFLRPITVDTARRYGTDLLDAWRDAAIARDRSVASIHRPDQPMVSRPRLTSHKLRAISAQTALAAGVPALDLQIRGSWQPPGQGGANRVLINHYLSRMVQSDFAGTLLVHIQSTASSASSEASRKASRA
jgi:hypothetical protein